MRAEAIKRAAGLCEAPGCGKPHLGRFEVDHVIADSHGGAATRANARVLCLPCHGAKTKLDTKIAAKIKRQEADRLGANPPPARKIVGKPLPGSSKPPRAPKASLPPRALFVDA